MSKATMIGAGIDAVAEAVARGLGKVKPEAHVLESAIGPVGNKTTLAIAREAAEGNASGMGTTGGNAAVARLLQRAKETNSESLLITKDGKPLVEWHASGASKAIETNSVTKSMTNLAVGKLVDQGKLKISEPVSTFYPEWLAGPKQQVTVEHLLNHTSGLPFRAKLPGVEGAIAEDLKAMPGAKFEYSNAGTDVLSGIVEAVSHKRLDRFVGDEFFTPMGIKDVSWRLDPQGHAFGAAGLSAHAGDLNKIGQMMANGGTWNGQRLISSEWIAESTKPSQAMNLNAGKLWWLESPKFRTDSGVPKYTGSAGFSARGYNGQYVTIFPRENVIGVRQIRNDVHASAADDFSDFPKLLKELLK